MASMTLAEEIAFILSTVNWDVSDKYGISLKVYAQEIFVSGRTQGYRLYVVAENSRNLSDKIFVYQLKPGLNDSGDPVTDFTNVASPADLEEYPPDTPVSVDRPFFRISHIDLVFRSPELLLAGFQGLVNDVVGLIQSLDYMEDIALAGTIDIGNPSDSSGSSSSSGPSVSSSSSSWPPDSQLHVHFEDYCGGGTAYMGQAFHIVGHHTGFLLVETVSAQDMVFDVPGDLFSLYISGPYPSSSSSSSGEYTDCRWPILLRTVPPAVPTFVEYESRPV